MTDDDPYIEDIKRRIAWGDVPGVVEALRRYLAADRLRALDDYRDLLESFPAATPEVIARRLAQQNEWWKDAEDRQVAEVEAWIRRGCRALQ